MPWWMNRLSTRKPLFVYDQLKSLPVQSKMQKTPALCSIQLNLFGLHINQKKSKFLNHAWYFIRTNNSCLAWRKGPVRFEMLISFPLYLFLINVVHSIERSAYNFYILLSCWGPLHHLQTPIMGCNLDLMNLSIWSPSRKARDTLSFISWTQYN